VQTPDRLAQLIEDPTPELLHIVALAMVAGILAFGQRDLFSRDDRHRRRPASADASRSVQGVRRAVAVTDERD
jgi:hypothetical protein